MSIRVITDVFCDKCPNWIHGPVTDRRQARAARYYAAEAGWVSRYEGGRLIDVCPECQSGAKEMPMWGVKIIEGDE
jgi:hypothetical protein